METCAHPIRIPHFFEAAILEPTWLTANVARFHGLMTILSKRLAGQARQALYHDKRSRCAKVVKESEGMNRDKAWDILNEYTKNVALIRHALCVEVVMRHYAKVGGTDEEQWGMAGLLHDFDYERWPEPPEHTREGVKILREAGFDEEILGAVLSHVPWNLEDYPRDRPIRKALFAADELSGFIYAAALVRPERIIGMKPKSITKKMKQKSFAAAVSREDIHTGAELLDLPLTEHIANCIEAITSIAAQIDILPPDDAATN